MATTTGIQAFLDKALAAQNSPHRVFVTLTFAQSVDAKIAGKDGRQLILSGKESMLMTHKLRSLHDAILIGIGTALNDNPQLNTRLLSLDDHPHNPLPVILDSGLRFRTDSKLIANFRAGTGRRPLIFASRTDECDHGFERRKKTIEDAGATVEVVEGSNGILSIPLVLSRLNELGVNSLMVEGGAKVITSFMKSGTFDRLIITVAPVFVGDDGVGYSADEDLPPLEYITSLGLDRDSVVAWKASNPGI